MADTLVRALDEAPPAPPARTRAPRVRKTPTTYVLRFVAAAYLFFLVAWPVSLVAVNTFDDSFGSIRALLEDPDIVVALQLSAYVAVWSVVINTIFGVGMSLLLVRYEFPGKRLLNALLDLPLSVSPIVVGLALVLVYGGRNGWFGPTLAGWGFDVIFSTPGIIMATTFVAPHSLHARPLVVPPNKEVLVVNRTPDVRVVVLVDGHRVGDAGTGGEVRIGLGGARTLLATLPEATFVSRYRQSFSA